ncbi:DUF2778 domain-containing protein [Mycobacterium sp. KBS0706]|uniref:DUF2778 domain-containing protein n=1 Tax=Mycobacterium sp. KBS0706 TaxID=2578109 RepID=UPI00110FB291|nr:DUF2778 domain-containing protein [Mycobacterium sp. KBS0706]TSD87794.1 DUF2778 domain-containing protein [Mycobacterium sp. KBS0706]
MVEDEIRIAPSMEARPSIGPIRVSVLAEVESTVGEWSGWPGRPLRAPSMLLDHSARSALPITGFSEAGLPRFRLRPNVCARYSIRVLAPGFDAAAVSGLALPAVGGGQTPANSHFDLWGSELRVRMRRRVWLRFDGKSLKWINGGSIEREWAAVSGREGHQSPREQNVADTGPIPAGTYLGDFSEFQDRRLGQSTVDWVAGNLGRGQWRGNEMSWGNYRLWLRPLRNVNTFGRDGFTIHGGWYPGSAGCIDLTGNMDDFAGRLRAYGQSVTVDVIYG